MNKEDKQLDDFLADLRPVLEKHKAFMIAAGERVAVVFIEQDAYFDTIDRETIPEEKHKG